MIRNATIMVFDMECDKCGKKLTDNHGAVMYDIIPRPLLEEARKQKWVITNGEEYCPDCAKMNKEKEDKQ